MPSLMRLSSVTRERYKEREMEHEEFVTELADRTLDELYEGLEGVQDAIGIYSDVEQALGNLSEAVSQDYTNGEWYMDGISLDNVDRTVVLDSFELSSAEGEIEQAISELRDIENAIEEELEGRGDA